MLQRKIGTEIFYFDFFFVPMSSHFASTAPLCTWGHMRPSTISQSLSERISVSHTYIVSDNYHPVAVDREQYK